MRNKKPIESLPSRAILEVIPTGKESALSQKVLSDLFGVPERVIRQSILNERIQGAVICADSSGYYYPSNHDELLSYYHSSMQRVSTTHRSLRATKKALEIVEGQRELELTSPSIPTMVELSEEDAE